MLYPALITRAGRSRCVARVISGVCDCVSVCVHARALEGKQQELSIPITSLAGPRHALTLRSRGQGQGHRIMKCAADMGMQVV